MSAHIPATGLVPACHSRQARSKQFAAARRWPGLSLPACAANFSQAPVSLPFPAQSPDLASPAYRFFSLVPPLIPKSSIAALQERIHGMNVGRFVAKVAVLAECSGPSRSGHHVAETFDNQINNACA